MKSVLITDLDNTLFNWFETWHDTFSVLVDEIIKIGGFEKDSLLAEIKKVHEKHGTAEYEFLIQEIPLLRAKHGNLNSSQIVDFYEEAIKSAQLAKHKKLSLYPAVLDTLKDLKSKGVIIIGYTESQAFYSGYRMRKLGLDGVLDFLYTPANHEMPTGVDESYLKKYGLNDYKLKKTVIRYTPDKKYKPSPEILLNIIAQVGAMPDQCIYVGDSLTKDIKMAQDAGISDVYAEYGVTHNTAGYELLRKVTHWTSEQVEAEKNTSSKNLCPSYTIYTFEQILNFFTFKAHEEIETNELANVLETWKTTVEVQKHFNELCLKSRQLAVTMLSAYIGALIYIAQDGTIHDFSVRGLLLICALTFIASLAWAVFYFHDRHGYHRLLKGAVLHGASIENAYKDLIPTIDLSRSIGRESKFLFFGKMRDSNWRVEWFYKCGWGVIMMPPVLYSIIWFILLSDFDYSCLPDLLKIFPSLG